MTEIDQETKVAYCPYCKRETIFIETVSPSGYFICTNIACFGYRTSVLKEKPKKKDVFRGVTIHDLLKIKREELFDENI